MRVLTEQGSHDMCNCIVVHTSAIAKVVDEILLSYYLALLISRLFICWRQIRVKALWTSLVFSRNSLFYPVSSPFQHKAGTGVVMMVVLLLLSASTVNSSLLLKSGDVEQNPGPSYLDGEIVRINWGEPERTYVHIPYNIICVF